LTFRPALSMGRFIVSIETRKGEKMFTHYYKGCYIHGYCDKPDCKVSAWNIAPSKVFKSYRAAQLAITKSVKEHDAAMMNIVSV
jgi:hypothetical protein